MNFRDEELADGFEQWTGRNPRDITHFVCFKLGAMWARNQIMHAMEQDNLMQWEGQDDDG